MVVANSPPRPRSAHSWRANCSGLLRGLERSHSNWSTREMLPTWMFSWVERRGIHVKPRYCHIYVNTLLCYSALNAVEIHNGIMLDNCHICKYFTYCKHNLYIRLVLHSKFSYSVKAAGTIWETTKERVGPYADQVIPPQAMETNKWSTCTCILLHLQRG